MNTEVNAKRVAIVTVSVLAALALLFVLARPWIERQIVAWLGDESNYEPLGDPSELKPYFQGADSDRDKLQVAMGEVAEGFTQPVDLQFVPGQPELLVVVQKTGQAVWVSTADPTQRGVLLEEEVVTASEQGLLGLAFHPKFAETGRLYTNATVKNDKAEVSQIAEWVVEPPGGDLREAKARKARVVMNVVQPYQNHNAGQLAFGPDGFLYVGWGDGGLAGDPRGHGQNTETLLGSMLRIDVDTPGEGDTPYAIPADNPFVGREGVRPEIWAYGLRNPWRYSFAPDGRLIVADVGQNRWEEIDLVAAGQNLGWKLREGRACFHPKEGCRADGLTAPIYVYDRDDGTSVTGGYVYTGAKVAGLKGRYVFGDFTSGRVWAIPVPDKPGEPVADGDVLALGRWPVLISSFGRDAAGELYLADFGGGRVLRIEAAVTN